MSVADGQRVNAAVSNAAFVSKTTDSTMVGVLGLNKPAEGDAVTSVQKAINKSFEGVGATDETDANINVYANHNYITSGDDRKVAVGKLDAALNVVQNSAATFTGNKTFSNDVTITGVATVNDTTQSTSKDTGALIVDGGVGIEKDVFIGGKIEVTGNLKSDGTTASIATTNSASTINIGSGSGANTINIGGASSTVNITGTVNNQNVTNLNVTDKLVTINDGGAAASGGAAGVEVEEDSVVTGYLKTSSDRNSWEIKAPNVAGVVSVSPESTNDEVVLKAKSQTLTNKTLTTPTINSGSLATPSADIITLDGQGSTPSNPSAGFYKTYVKDSTGKLNILNSSGVETEIGGADAATLVTAASGDLAATTLNAALAELALEKQPRTWASASGGATLTATSNYYQVATGASTNTYTLPVASTLSLGHSFRFRNESTSYLIVRSSGSNNIVFLKKGEVAEFTCILTSGTDASSWSYSIIKNIGYHRSTTMSGGTTTLGIDNLGVYEELQIFTGSSNHTVKLPYSGYDISENSAYSVGTFFEIANKGTGVLTVNDYNSSFVTKIYPKTSKKFLKVDTSNSISDWNIISDSSERKPRTYTTTATAAGTTTLTIASEQQQFFTGTTTQTVVLPVASTMTLGFGFEIFNNSTGVVTVNSSGSNLVQSMAAGSKLEVICILASGTDAASWQVVYVPSLLTAAQPTLSVLTATSAEKTPAGSDQYHSLTSNSVTLTAGTWDVDSSATFTNNGSSPTYAYTAVGIFGANGGDSGAAPTLLSSTSNLTVNSAYDSTLPFIRQSNTGDLTRSSGPRLIITVTASVTIYVVTLSGQSTSANARVKAYMTARRLY